LHGVVGAEHAQRLRVERIVVDLLERADPHRDALRAPVRGPERAVRREPQERRGAEPQRDPVADESAARHDRTRRVSTWSTARRLPSATIQAPTLAMSWPVPEANGTPCDSASPQIAAMRSTFDAIATGTAASSRIQ